MFECDECMKEYKKEMKRYTERNPSEKDTFRDMFEYEEAKYTKHYTDQTHRTSGLRSWDDLLFSVSGIQSEGSYPRREDSGSRLCQGVHQGKGQGTPNQILIFRTISRSERQLVSRKKSRKEHERNRWGTNTEVKVGTRKET